MAKPKILPRTIAAIKKRNKANGGLFFDPEVLEFQHTRIMNVVRNGYFITSEGTKKTLVSRTYTIRQCDIKGNITRVAKYDSFTEAYTNLKTL